MTPNEIKAWRLELGLTVEEFAWALDIPEVQLAAIEAGLSQAWQTRQFNDAVERLEERLFGTFAGA